ncbi:hypothetical protein QJS10_CPA10g00905 [Acorus calamus]|uniref:adenylate kinase n=1 Tax=Acorus calamus TaxID=4465 RepID=A0AAV9E1N8_ACOCL|nr:hypothetical protein QJS10_CPA10g00905 [Acorus calamus]
MIPLFEKLKSQNRATKRIVKSRKSKSDVKERGWLLDGYPWTAAQAQSLERLGIRPDFCVVLDVPDQILVDRCVGRRLDPVTRKIYHVEYDAPESEEVNVRLIIHTDDIVEKLLTNHLKKLKQRQVVWNRESL